MLGLVDHWQHCLILKVEFRRRGRAWGADCMYITKRSSWSLSGEWIEECSEWIKGNQLGGHCNILSWRGGGLVKGGGSIGEKWVDLRGILKQRLTGLVGGSATQTRGGMYQRWLRGFWLGNMKEWWCQSLRLYAKWRLGEGSLLEKFSGGRSWNTMYIKLHNWTLSSKIWELLTAKI